MNFKKITLLAVILTAGLVAGCSPTQYVYSDRLTVEEIEISTIPERGKYKYTTSDGDGSIVIWSNQEFKFGDELFITVSN